MLEIGNIMHVRNWKHYACKQLETLCKHAYVMYCIFYDYKNNDFQIKKIVIHFLFLFK